MLSWDPGQRAGGWLGYPGTMCSVQCAVCIVQCGMFSVQCAVFLQDGEGDWGGQAAAEATVPGERGQEQGGQP